MKKRENTDINGIKVTKLPYIPPKNPSNNSRYKKKDASGIYNKIAKK